MMKILFVIVVAAIITFSSIALGQYLLAKSQSVSENETEDGENFFFEGMNFVTVPKDSPKVFSGGILLSDLKSDNDVSEQIKTLSAYYDTLIVNITDSRGTLLYSSPALSEATRCAPGEGTGILESIRKHTSVYGMRLTACLNYDMADCRDYSYTDSVIASELDGIGFDEIIVRITGIDTLSADDTRFLCGYLSCFADTGLRTGVLLPAEVFLDASAARQVQMTANCCSFLAIEFSFDSMSTTADVYRSVSSAISSLTGTFGVYGMRAVIADGEKTLMTAAYNACMDSGVTNLGFLSPVIPDRLDYKADGEEKSEAENIPAEEENVPEIGTNNPYASTYDDSGE